MSDKSEPICPRLRPVDVRPIEHEGRPYLLLRDPQQLGDRLLLVPQPLAAVLAFCDGAHTPAEMADAFQAYYGFSIEIETVEELLAALDEAFLLDNGRAAAAHQAALAGYRTAPFRPPICAGQSYPAEPAALYSLLQDYLEAAGTAGDGVEAEWPQRVGLLSPHIDYGRGGPVYAQVWKQAAAAVRRADLVILIGTDHYGDDPVTLTRQSYATPYGVLPTDTAIVDALASLLGEEAAFAGELRHRDEHSLELVAVWLHHLRQGEPCPVVPILVGSLNPLLANGSAPPLLDQLLHKLEAMTAGKRVVIVASGDLAHVGPAFDSPPLDEAGRSQLRSADVELLGHMAAGDYAGFYAAIRRTANSNNVCGVAPIYWTIRLLENGHGRPVSGEQAGYAVCPADQDGSSVVTVAGMIFR